jgi:hypothetical protein
MPELGPSLWLARLSLSCFQTADGDVFANGDTYDCPNRLFGKMGLLGSIGADDRHSCSDGRRNAGTVNGE